MSKLSVVLIALLGLIILCCAETYVRELKSVPKQWKLSGSAPKYHLMSVWLPLHVHKVKELEAVIYAVSDPRSPQYGQHWTREQILDLIAPPKAHEEAVINYLIESGFDATEIRSFRDTILLVAPVYKLEALFSTNIYTFVSESYKRDEALVAIGKIVVPEEIAPYVATVIGISDFPESTKAKPTPRPDDGFFPLDGKIVPSTLHRIYNITTIATNINNTVAAGEYQHDDCFAYSDMAQYEADGGVAATNVSRIIGTRTWQNSGCDAESGMDLELLLAVAQGAQVWYFSNKDWMYTFAQHIQTIPKPPLVTSISWGWMEADQCSLDTVVCQSHKLSNAQYINRTDIEFMKIGVMGLTIIVCSQDEGAPSDNNMDCDNTDTPVWPIYPATSPWVTTVGATALLDADTIPSQPEQRSPICSQINCSNGTVEATAMPENAAYTSGGGFSVLVSRPTYQQTAVTGWLNQASAACQPLPGKYNPSGRGYPDLSAVGEEIFIVLGGDPQYNGGTSAATPIVSGVIALLNDYRLNNGLAPLGFLNPLLYQMAANMPTAFNDVVLGNNSCTAWGSDAPCCANSGYCALPGWDPATGLGTPNHGNMLAYLQAMDAERLAKKKL